jgi:Protein of unknown function (DUF3293)
MHCNLRQAYRMTRYEVAGVIFRVGHRSPGVDRLLASRGCRTATFVTAFNPYSRRMPPGWNRRMQARLARTLNQPTSHRPIALPGTGSWRGWCEQHLLLLGDPGPAIHLARRFRQHAVVVLSLRQPARLVSTARSKPSN